MLALVSAPLAPRADIFADNHRLGGPVAGLVDVPPVAANVSGRDPIRARSRGTIPAAGNPIPPSSAPVPEAADPNRVRPWTPPSSLMPNRGRPTRRDPHVQTRKRRWRRDRNLRKSRRGHTTEDRCGQNRSLESLESHATSLCRVSLATGTIEQAMCHASPLIETRIPNGATRRSSRCNPPGASR